LEKNRRGQGMNAPSLSAPAVELIVRVLKHDGRKHRCWRGRIAKQEDSLIVLEAEFDVDVSHHLLGEIKRGTRLIEYYWLERWYNVFRFLHEDGSTRLYYCNVNKPPSFDGHVLTYIDLDIDVIVRADLSYDVLDLEEFEANSKAYGYSTEEQSSAAAAVEELIRLIQAREFPFQPLKADAAF
jgi:protein associated with RNAse G/E